MCTQETANCIVVGSSGRRDACASESFPVERAIYHGLLDLIRLEAFD